MDDESLYNIMKIETLVLIRDKLEQYRSDIILFEIYEKISVYIDTNCNHSFINDYIDTSLDNSKCITYCEICNKTK